MWIDTHCHLPALTSGASAALATARERDVEAVICVGTDVASSRDAIALAEAEADVWATVGLHPHDAKDFDAVRNELEALAETSRVVGIGETGLDFFYNYSEPDAQVRAFRSHLALAERFGLACVVHVRDAWDVLFEIFEDQGAPDRTILHCFTGGPDELARALPFGCYISFSGIVSFKNAEPVRAAAAGCPEDRLLIETDAPYLAPVPHRGDENRPAYVADVGCALAAARDVPPEVIAGITTANARRVFGLPHRN